ncbi:DUF1707 domain-containing protein [Streptomyces sp. BI20]|uniref:DUF1707 domain-containing protein n=1 Tax=Streptomyces sp. BI20 TaxID=3403460 RepID=UPI003C793131
MSDERAQEPLPEKTSLEKAPEGTGAGGPGTGTGPAPGAGSRPEAVPAVPAASGPVASGPGAVPGAPAPDPALALRASDADRDRVVERLRDAVAEGRLDMTEFEERMEAAYASRTYAELEPLTRDLPPVPGTPMPFAAHPPVPAGTGAGVSPARPGEGSGIVWAERVGVSAATTASGLGVGVMSGFQRRGAWTVPQRFDAVAFWGGGELDLREAYFATREVVINCVAIMGGVQIVVPPGVEVDLRGFGFMGGFDHDHRKAGPVEPGAPRVVVTGFAFWGGVEIKHKPLKGRELPGSGRKEL